MTKAEQLIDLLTKHTGVSLGSYFSRVDVELALRELAKRGLAFDEDTMNASSGGWIELTRREAQP